MKYFRHILTIWSEPAHVYVAHQGEFFDATPHHYDYGINFLNAF